MRLPLPTSLRGRLLVWVALVAAILLMTASLVSSAVLHREFDAAVDQGLTERSSDVAAAWHPGSSAPLADPFAQVVAHNGEVLARSAAAPSYSIVDPQQFTGLAASGLRLDSTVPELRGPTRIFARPAHGDVVVVAAPLEALDSARERLRRETLTLLALLLVGLLAITWVLVGAALRPVDRMTQAANRLLTSPTRPGALPVPAGDDEISRLAVTLNRLLTALAAVIDRERALVDDASHELRTPLSTLSAELELALDEPDETARREGMEHALGAARRLSILADDLLLLARESGGTVRPRTTIALLPWLTETVQGVLPPAVRVVVTGEPVDVSADPLALARVVGNLLRNAAAAGARTIAVQVADLRGMAVVTFADDGAGFSDDGLAHAFERFYRGDAARDRLEASTDTSGAGLGLAIVKAVVEGLGGSVSADNAAEAPAGRGGAVIELRLPAHPRSIPSVG